MSTTEVVLESIERYYAAVMQEERSAEDALASAGFIGCANGPADLSTNYKQELTRTLGRKA